MKVTELEQYHTKYLRLLDSSTAHSKQMLSSVLDITLMPGVMDAISHHNSSEKATHGT